MITTKKFLKNLFVTWSLPTTLLHLASLSRKIEFKVCEKYQMLNRSPSEINTHAFSFLDLLISLSKYDLYQLKLQDRVRRQGREMQKGHISSQYKKKKFSYAWNIIFSNPHDNFEYLVIWFGLHRVLSLF